MYVARTLLDAGLQQEAEQGGEPRLLCRGRTAAVKCLKVALPMDKRFVFFDQVHTTGIDIILPQSARAAVTIGKDSTFRDPTQGAFGTRGIEHGQTISVLITPRVPAG